MPNGHAIRHRYVRGLQNANRAGVRQNISRARRHPVDSHDRPCPSSPPPQRLDQIDLPPFRAAIGAGVAALLSRARRVRADRRGAFRRRSLDRLCGETASRRARFRGGALLRRPRNESHYRALVRREAAVEAVWAGCDAVLVCSDEDAQARVHEALTRAAEREPTLSRSVQRGATRVLRLRRPASRPIPRAKAFWRSSVTGQFGRRRANRRKKDRASRMMARGGLGRPYEFAARFRPSRWTRRHLRPRSGQHLQPLGTLTDAGFRRRPHDPDGGLAAGHRRGRGRRAGAPRCTGPGTDPWPLRCAHPLRVRRIEARRVRAADAGVPYEDSLEREEVSSPPCARCVRPRGRARASAPGSSGKDGRTRVTTAR